MFQVITNHDCYLLVSVMMATISTLSITCKLSLPLNLILLYSLKIKIAGMFSCLQLAEKTSKDDVLREALVVCYNLVLADNCFLVAEAL